MSYRKLLGQNLTEESPAYGYTLVIWGSGALLFSSFSLDTYSIMMYVFGGITGFAVLALAAFGGLMTKVNERDMKEPAASMIHVLAAFGAVAINYFLIQNTLSGMDIEYVALTIGFTATASYNVLLLIEHLLYEDMYEIEKGRNGELED